MPLGDSITVGSFSGVVPNEPQFFISYRKELWDLLKAAGYNVDFVGSQINGQAYLNFDPHHEGHGGKTDDYIANNIYDWLSSTPADVILLHIGTNSLDTDPDDVAAILDNIDTYEVDNGVEITVVLARIINRLDYVCSNPPTPSTTTTFNDNVAAMAQNRINTQGDKIVLVDMECGAGIVYSSYTSGGDMYDTVHPYATGYEKMADEWMQALGPVLNKAPVLTDPGSQAHAENALVSLPIQVTDLNENDTHTFDAENLPPGVSINPDTGLISGTVSFEAYSGLPYTVVVTATDSGTPAYSDSLAFTWTITNTNRPPSISTILPTQFSDEGQEISLQISASDPDSADQLTFSAASLPLGLQIDAQTGLISGTISFDAFQGAAYGTVITVTDDGPPQPASDSISFSWIIDDVNRPPLVNMEDLTSLEGQLVSYSIDASDLDGDALTFKATGLPSGLSLNPDTGLVSGTLPIGQSGLFPVELTVSDGQEQVQVNFIWTVIRRFYLIYLPFSNRN
jgi:lysophospholipase L1-like esterase